MIEEDMQAPKRSYFRKFFGIASEESNSLKLNYWIGKNNSMRNLDPSAFQTGSDDKAVQGLHSDAVFAHAYEYRGYMTDHDNSGGSSDQRYSLNDSASVDFGR